MAAAMALKLHIFMNGHNMRSYTKFLYKGYTYTKTQESFLTLCKGLCYIENY